MTSQLTRAMAEYPDELRVVMEAAKWKYHGPISAWRDESVEWTRTATDNDAIVACIEWLVNGGRQIDLCEWTTTGLLIQALELVRRAEEWDERFEEDAR